MDEEMATKLLAMEKELDAKREEEDRKLAESLAAMDQKPKENNVDEELAKKLAEEERNFELLKAKGK